MGHPHLTLRADLAGPQECSLARGLQPAGHQIRVMRHGRGGVPLGLAHGQGRAPQQGE